METKLQVAAVVVMSFILAVMAGVLGEFYLAFFPVGMVYLFSGYQLATHSSSLCWARYLVLVIPYVLTMTLLLVAGYNWWGFTVVAAAAVAGLAGIWLRRLAQYERAKEYAFFAYYAALLLAFAYMLSQLYLRMHK